MNPTARCLEKKDLYLLINSELADERLETVEEHLSSCATCRAALDQAIADSEWWQLARTSLSSADDARATPDEESESAQLQSVLSLLGPSDDPARLGRIANYEVVGILGRGGMGVVFKAFDAPLNRYVAIKLLLPHLAISGAARKRFAREAQAAAAVVDDYVMAIHSVAEWQGTPYLVMPYCSGVSLQKRLSQEGPLELREIFRIGAQTAKGLAAAHKQGLVHRDVKPANILLPDGVERVSLTDFGLARAIDDASVTRTGVLAGTPQYMSPEQASAKPVDARSDLFSLGSVLYAMCTGRAPFRAETSYGVLRLITDEEPTPIRQINPDIPDWFCLLIERLMAKQPEQRFDSAQEVAELLEQCLAHLQQPGSASLPEALLRARQPEKTFSRLIWPLVTWLLLPACMLLAVSWAAREWWPSGQIAGNEAALESRRQAAAFFVNTKLQGTWQMVESINSEGVTADASHVRAVTYIIRGQMIEFHNSAEPDNVNATRFSIDAASFPLEETERQPKQIEFTDFTTKDSAAGDSPMLGLCDSDGTTLRICWGPKRPETLAPAPGVTYAELRRDPTELLQRQLQGTWKLTRSLSDDGHLHDIETPEAGRPQLVFLDGRAELALVVGQPREFNFTLDASPTPPTIDLRAAKSDKPLRGLLELTESGTLKLRLADEATSDVRPVKLAAEPGARYYEFRRDHHWDWRPMSKSKKANEIDKLSPSISNP